MTITFATDTTDIIDEIREVIGRPITFNYFAGYTNCSICTLNPITGESTSPFCSGCGGTYYIPIESGYIVDAHIVWDPSNLPQYVTGGKYFEGSCLVQVKYTPELLTILDTTENVTVDGKVMEIRKQTMRGVPTINRILLELIEKSE
jgi:hypothetical protein